MADSVAAIILNWNCAEDTLRCLRAVRPQGISALIVVDNGSTDGSPDVLRARAADEGFTFVETGANLGYAGGMNAGMRKAAELGAQRVWLLNADAVPRPGALAGLLAHAGEFGVLASRQVTSADPSDARTEPYVVAAHLENGKPRPYLCPGGEGHEVHPVDVVTGASIFLDLPGVLAIGLFDERFFHYKEEFDLVVRMAAAGHRVGLACGSEVWHERGGSLSGASPRARYYANRNEVLFIRKHYPHPLRRMLLAEPAHYRNVALGLVGAVTGGAQKRRVSRAILAGYLDGVRGVDGPTDRF